MKFTRSLALAAAAALAMSMTACDDDTTTGPDATVEINKTSFSLGTQEQINLASALSVRFNGVIKVADLDVTPANVERIDLILWEDFNATSKKLDVNQAKLWSPDAFATDEVQKFTSLAKDYILKNSVAKARQTRFAKISLANLDDIETRGDLDDIVADITPAQWSSTIIVETGNVIVINASGTYAIAKVTANAVPASNPALTSTTDGKAVNIDILVAQKI